MSQIEDFIKIVESAKLGENGLIFVTGKPGSGKSKVLREAAHEKHWQYVDARELISEEFLAIPQNERQNSAPQLMGDILKGYDSEVILLDRVQTLFVPVFRLEVDALLEKLSERFIIVVAWPGYQEADKLCYDKFDGSESIRIPVSDHTIWNVE